MSVFPASTFLNQRDLYFIEGETIPQEHIQTIVARYNRRTNYLYVLSSEIRSLDDESQNALKNSEQFIGCATLHFWKGTGVRGTAKAVHIFDLNKPDLPRQDPQREERRETYLKSLKRRYGDDYKTITPLMERWDLYNIPNAPNTRKQTRENAIITALQKQIDRLTRELQDVKPSAKLSKLSKQNKPRTKLPELDAYIKTHTNNIRTDITKKIIKDGIPQLYPRPKPTYLSFKDSLHQRAEYNAAKAEYMKEYMEANGPTYDPRAQGNDVCGLYKQTITLTQTKPKRTYHLLAKTLKAAVPNYKDDIRFSHIQSTKIEYDKNIGSVRCAVFDWS